MENSTPRAGKYKPAAKAKPPGKPKRAVLTPTVTPAVAAFAYGDLAPGDQTKLEKPGDGSCPPPYQMGGVESKFRWHGAGVLRCSPNDLTILVGYKDARASLLPERGHCDAGVNAASIEVKTGGVIVYFEGARRSVRGLH